MFWFCLGMLPGISKILPVIVPSPAVQQQPPTGGQYTGGTVRAAIEQNKRVEQPGDTWRYEPIRLRPCEVCGERATGYHFGVISCEACKVKTLQFKRIFFFLYW